MTPLGLKLASYHFVKFFWNSPFRKEPAENAGFSVLSVNPFRGTSQAHAPAFETSPSTNGRYSTVRNSTITIFFNFIRFLTLLKTLYTRSRGFAQSCLCLCSQDISINRGRPLFWCISPLIYKTINLDLLLYPARQIFLRVIPIAAHALPAAPDLPPVSEKPLHG